jgi:hypothetical protein
MYASILWDAELLNDEMACLIKEILKQHVEGVAWLD